MARASCTISSSLAKHPSITESGRGVSFSKWRRHAAKGSRASRRRSGACTPCRGTRRRPGRAARRERGHRALVLATAARKAERVGDVARQLPRPRVERRRAPERFRRRIGGEVVDSTKTWFEFMLRRYQLMPRSATRGPAVAGRAR